MQVKALTLIFIAGAALAAGGLAYAQSQIVKGDPEPAMTQNSHANHPASAPSGNPAVRAYQDANDLARLLTNQTSDGVTGGDRPKPSLDTTVGDADRARGGGSAAAPGFSLNKK